MLTPLMERKDTAGWFIRPSRELKNRLQRLAKEYKKPSGNQLVLEILEQYVESWENAEKAKRKMLEDFERTRSELLQKPMIVARTEPDAKPLAKRKTR